MSYLCHEPESGCHSWHPHHFNPSHYHYAEPCLIYYVPYCPACSQPIQLCGCKEEAHLIPLPKEAVADPTTLVNEILIGGLGESKLTLEYLPVNATAMVKVTITSSGGTTSIWQEDPVATINYHVKDDLPKVSPGSKVILEVKDAIARLRWCEKIECQ